MLSEEINKNASAKLYAQFLFLIKCVPNTHAASQQSAQVWVFMLFFANGIKYFDHAGSYD
jgi:hypothetical protein